MAGLALMTVSFSPASLQRPAIGALIGGGALLDIELQRFFYAIGIPMFQGYGLSECAPVVSSNSERKHKLGSSGYLVKNLDLKICDDKGNELPECEKGEIVVRGENVMAGYWNNPAATSEALKDGNYEQVVVKNEQFVFSRTSARFLFDKYEW
jgi:long-subunit acyl-CoA synthetase (AMP-forming)